MIAIVMRENYSGAIAKMFDSKIYIKRIPVFNPGIHRSRCASLIGLVLGLMMSSICPAIAQENINFTHIGSNEGLSSSTVTAILKDRYGLMWFATEDGLNKFDGTGITVYRNRLHDAKSLQANEILSLHEDKEGRLWVGTGGGSLSLYDRRHDNFIHFAAGNGEKSLRNAVIKSICSDRAGRIWIGTHDGVNIYDPATRSLAELQVAGSKSFSLPVMCVRQDSRGQMWLATTQGVYVIDPATYKAKHYYHIDGDANSLPNNVVHALLEDKEGNMWLGTHGGLSKKSASGNAIINYRHSDASLNSIANDAVLALALDEQGRVWAGTEGGITVVNGKTGFIKNYTYNPRNMQGLSERAIQSIYFDSLGICWIGTTRGGINKYDRNLTIFNHIKSNAFDPLSLPSPLVSAFEDAGDGNIFVGTEHGGVSRFNPETRLFQRYNIKSPASNNNDLVVLALKKTRSNKLLIGTFSTGLMLMDPGSGEYRQLLPIDNSGNSNSNDIYAICEDRKGNIWLGTNGDGLILLNSSFQLIARYMPNPVGVKDKPLAMNGYIRDIIEDGAGNIWFATHGGGVGKLEPSSGQLHIYNQANSGLASDKVQSLLLDRKGNIWTGTFGGGLGLFNPNTHQFSIYSEQDGLANNNVYKILEDTSGKLWLSSNKGLSRFDPVSKKFSNYNTHNGLQSGSFSHGSGLVAANGRLYFGGQDGFNYFDLTDIRKNDQAPQILFTDLRISNQSVVPTANAPISENISVAKTISLHYKQNFALSFVGLNYSAPEQNQYAYKLDGLDKDWTELGHNNTVNYTNLSPGDYVFRVRASNNDGVWNKTGNSIRISVLPPFWRTNLAYIFYALMLIALLFFLRYLGIQKVKRKFKKEQEEMKLEQERREAERIHEMDLQKIKFLTNLSHEFRTPVSLILGPVDAMIKQQKEEQDFGQLHLIKRNARRLLNLVNQLLDFRKLEENELQIHLQEGDLVLFTREVSDSFRDLSDRKKIVFKFSSCVPQLKAKFDFDKLERVLFNLLSNAFKFTLQGGTIQLAIEAVSSQSQSNRIWVTFAVKDTGVGIPAEQCDKIFEHFYQANSGPSILNQGSGIGLSITREFVKLLGGEITVESQPGKGTNFTVRMPFEAIENIETVADDAGLQPTVDSKEEHSPAATEKTEQEDAVSVLLVEDNDDFRYYLKDILEQQYKVYEASNGKEGWQKTLAQHPHIVVSDISMPYMDGIELCSKIKSDKRTHHIPVILLTALAGENNQLRGLETGANDYITKPFNADVLNAKVKNLLTLNENFKHTYSKQIKVLTPEVEVASEDERLMYEIMSYLEENLTDTQLSVEGLSRHVGMSRSSLYSKLLELTGKTPVEFIRSVKLEKAALLLEKSDMNIAQVAYSVGFATPNYFAKSFKAKYNMLPSEYLLKKRN